MIDELSFLNYLTYYSQYKAYSIYYHVYSHETEIEEECLEDFYLSMFIKILKNNLERHGFRVIALRKELDDYGEQYTVILLGKYKIIIRETIMCGTREGFEFLIVNR